MEQHRREVLECVDFLRSRLPLIPDTFIQLGTGLGDFDKSLEIEFSLDYEQIPHFPSSTVTSHHGKLLVGRLNSRPVGVLQGRFHYYEGYSTREISFPIRVLSLLDVDRLIITNAAGGLNPLFLPGSIMVISDHLNFLGENPLRGPNVDEWGPRFPDFSTPYNPELIKIALDSATTCGVANVISGTYVCIPGPSLETPAETRWLRSCGGDAVGMSSIPEIIVARHAGLDVLGLSVVSNVNDPDNFQPIILEDIIATAAEMEPKLSLLIGQVIKELPPGSQSTGKP
ncbi:MAG: purine-nucleoside phosphorylase [Thermodesulfobacteriota bacterium]